MDVPAAHPISFFFRLFFGSSMPQSRHLLLVAGRDHLLNFWENAMTNIVNTLAAPEVQSRLTTLMDKAFPFAVVAGLGLVLLYGAAFAETPALHNAGHDGRHSAGFPCH